LTSFGFAERSNIVFDVGIAVDVHLFPIRDEVIEERPRARIQSEDGAPPGPIPEQQGGQK
jgi:hypothetical protein